MDSTYKTVDLSNVENGDENLNLVMSRINNSLLSASRDGNIEAVRYLVEQRGANIEARDYRSGNTPLICASENGNCEVVKYLIE